MFQNRRSSRKPDEELVNSFRRSFPGICATKAGTPSPPEQRPDTPMLEASLVPSSLPVRMAVMEGEERKPSDQMANGVQDQWRFTPSLMDPNSVAFSSLASQPPAYYTTSSPTVLGLGSVSGSVSGAMTDMRTPGINMSSLTALPIPNSLVAHDSVTVASTLTVNGAMFQHPFVDPMRQAAFDPTYVHQPTFAPGSFLNRAPDFGILEHSIPGPQHTLHALHHPIHNNSVTLGLLRHHDSADDFETINDPNHGDFRFQVVLRAATAMIKEPDEIPITYLNKGQAYTITIVDSDPMKSGIKPTTYRTYVRISFEEEEQRSNPANCWQLWKEGRGANEAHQRNGKLLAVEHVDPNQGGDGEPRNQQIHLQHACFDGFSVIWTPNQLSGRHECAISVRFNFLSTDFSHSKGVKGIPVRLCAKTEAMTTTTHEPPVSESPEVCYCKVKLFRDHGAERKLSNDITHVKKMIDKYKNQVAQAEAGSSPIDKRKRNGAVGGKVGKAFKHKRTWSLSESGKPSLEEDLQMKLESLQEMFSSTRPISYLNLKGDPQDDPDLFPVQFSGGSGDRNNSNSNNHHHAWDMTHQNGDGPANTVSPATSNNSYASSHRSFGANGAAANGYPNSRNGSLDWSGASQHESGEGRAGARGIGTFARVRRATGADEEEWLEAMDVDSDYQPPPKTPKKPKCCCFYIRPQALEGQQSDGYYRAIYLSERTAQDLTHEVARKCRFESSNIQQVVYIRRHNGLPIALDDEVVQQMPEGQDMVVEFSELRNGPTSCAREEGSISSMMTKGLEMRLIF